MLESQRVGVQRMSSRDINSMTIEELRKELLKVQVRAAKQRARGKKPEPPALPSNAQLREIYYERHTSVATERWGMIAHPDVVEHRVHHPEMSEKLVLCEHVWRKQEGTKPEIVEVEGKGEMILVQVVCKLCEKKGSKWLTFNRRK